MALGYSSLRYARAMHERLPQVGAVFEAGYIDFRLLFRTTLSTELITDAARWPPWAAKAIKARCAINDQQARTEVDRVVPQIDRAAFLVRGCTRTVTWTSPKLTGHGVGQQERFCGNRASTRSSARRTGQNRLPRRPADCRTGGAAARSASGRGQDLPGVRRQRRLPVASAPTAQFVVIDVVADRHCFESGGSRVSYGDGIIPAEMVAVANRQSCNQSRCRCCPESIRRLRL